SSVFHDLLPTDIYPLSLHDALPLFMASQTVYRVRPHNAATESENKTHHDDVAQRHGFRGGLVPGVTVYAYMTHPVVALFGRVWRTEEHTSELQSLAYLVCRLLLVKK